MDQTLKEASPWVQVPEVAVRNPDLETVRASTTVQGGLKAKTPLTTSLQNQETMAPADDDVVFLECVNRSGVGTFPCDVCKNNFLTLQHLISHKFVHTVEKRHNYISKGNSRTGEKLFVCKICNKSLSRESKLVEHERLHAGKNLYVCEVCHKSFTTSSNLKRHSLTHTGEKPFSCNFCQVAFSRKGSLENHMRYHTGKRPYQCKVCPKTFYRSHHLVVHSRTHTGEKPYVCEVCHKGFTSSGNLKAHSLMHTGEKPFTCAFCPKAFTSNGKLKQHSLTHTGEKPYSCDICKKTFTQQGSRRYHLMTQHLGQSQEKEAPLGAATEVVSLQSSSCPVQLVPLDLRKTACSPDSSSVDGLVDQLTPRGSTKIHL